MTNKDQLKQELNAYTKDEIIEALAACDNNIIVKVRARLFKAKNTKLDALIDAAFTAWKDASQDHINYLKSLEAKYGKFDIRSCTTDEIQKYIALTTAERIANERLEKLYKEQDKLYEKTR